MDDRTMNRRRLLGLSGVAAVSALSGCASVVQQTDNGSTQTPTEAQTETPPSQNETTTETTEAPETTEQTAADGRPKTISEPQFDLSTTQLPEQTPDPRYPTIGTADTTVTVYGNWKCPYTQEFVRQQFGGLVDEFVVTGDVSVEYRNVAYLDGEPNLGTDAPRAAEAGLAVWDVDQSAFWEYFSYVFANQPQERFEWATTDNLVRIANRATVEGLDQIRQSIRSRAYSQSVTMSSERASELGVSTVPRVVYGDTVTAPTVDPESTREQFERAAKDSDSTASGASVAGTANATSGNTTQFGTENTTDDNSA
jgi:protein-disulfide isomerase